MKLFGLNITVTLIIVALIFYVVGAKFPGVAQKFLP